MEVLATIKVKSAEIIKGVDERRAGKGFEERLVKILKKIY